MNITNNINCTPYLLACQRQKIEAFFNKKLKSMGKTMADFSFQRETLVKYQEIENGKLNLKFDFDAKAKNYDSERGVDSNDTFIPTGYALGLLTTPMISVGKYESIENQQIHYFNNKNIFNHEVEDSTVTQAMALEPLYYSTLGVTIAGQYVTTEFDVRNLKRIPESEIGGEFYYPNGVFAPLTEFPILNGGSGIEYRFDVASADTKAASGNPEEEKTYAVFMIEGYKIYKMSENYNGLGCKCVK